MYRSLYEIHTEKTIKLVTNMFTMCSMLLLLRDGMSNFLIHFVQHFLDFLKWLLTSDETN